MMERLTDEVEKHYDANQRFKEGPSDKPVEARDPTSDRIVMYYPRGRLT